MKIKKSHGFRRFIGVMALISGFIACGTWLVNRPETLSNALAIANAAGRLKIEVGSFRWQPLKGRLSLESISLTDKKTGKSATAASADIGYALLGVVRGKLVIDELALKDVKIHLPVVAQPEKETERKRLNLAKLLLLRHIEILDASASGVTVGIGDDKTITMDELRAALVPSIMGDARIAIRSDGLKIDKDDRKMFSAGSVSIKAETKLDRWDRTFPYANALSGELKINDMVTAALSADDLSATMSFDDEKVDLKEFSLIVGGRELKGMFNADLNAQDFALDISIAKPMSLPHIGPESQVFDTAGQLSGNVKLSGKGFSPAKSKGSGNASLSHRFDASPDKPVSVDTAFSWDNGTINIPSGTATGGSDAIAFSGTVGIASKSMDIKASGSHFPIEHLFEKFKNPHLKKIFGSTDFEANVTGWGKEVNAKIKGVTLNGGWQPIIAERVETDLSITYNELSMQNTVFSGTRASGTSDLKVKFGEKMSDGRRHKDIDLAAEAHDIPLDNVMAAFALKGIGNGRIELSGPHTDFHGTAKISVAKGSWHSMPFERATTDMNITRHEIAFTNIEAGLPGQPIRKLDGDLVADLTPGKMKLHGEPIKGLIIDGTYTYAPKTWNFSELSWSGTNNERLEAKGRLTSGGPVDLAIDGTIDTTALSLLTPSLYRGTGPLRVDLNVRGTTGDPKFFGSIDFKGNAVVLRNPRVALENVSGAIKFDGSRVRFEGLSAGMGEGSMTLSGWIDQHGMKPVQSDLVLAAKEMVWRSEDGYLMLEFEGNLSLVGKFPNPLLSGNMTILDGKYTKDFTILEAFTGGGKTKERKETERLDFDPRLALSIRNSGEMEIQNNVGDIWLNVNMNLSGTRSKPVVAGSVNADSGSVHYLGLRFDITKGFLEFRGDVEAPYLEVYAEREIDVYNVNLILHGPIDNLALDLSATSPSGPLEKRDVVSLLLFGMTEQERIAVQKEGLSAAMVAQSITSVIERPIAKFTKLDVFRFEAPETAAQGISRLNVGKKLSDRLTVNFATDIGVDNAVQTFSAEYQITDNLLLKGSHSTDSNYELNGILRFRIR